MGSFRWSDSYATSIGAIDDDHRNLFELVDAIENHHARGSDTESITASINGLVLYANEHFEREERFLRRVHYPDFHKHRQSHEDFKTMVNALRRMYAANPKTVDLTKVTSFLGKWILDHIMIQDQKYVPYLTGQRSAPDPESGPMDRRTHGRQGGLEPITVTIPLDKEPILRRFVELVSEGGELADAFETALIKHMNDREHKIILKAKKLFGTETPPN
ncbi:MAG: bacteriohemerythrin [Rhodospirillaceae bacterium]